MRDLSVSRNRIGNVLVAQRDAPAAADAYRAGLAIVEALAARDPANTEWQRDLSISHNKIGNVLVAHGDRSAASDAFTGSDLAIAEALAARYDPANALWQTDLAFSCAKLGSLPMQDVPEHTVEIRRQYLLRGREILADLKQQDRLHAGQDFIAWFDDHLQKLTTDEPPNP